MTPPITTRLPVSVCMIAGAEAARIHRALDSVSSWVSEIIVIINADVTDGTDKICETAGAKVFRETWKGYVAQKNSATDKATQPWVLNLDADEEVSPALHAELAAALTKPDNHVAFCFPRSTNFCGRWIHHGDWYPDWQTRLWRRGQARWVGVNVHERLEVDGSIGVLHADLLHHTAETIDRQIAKISIYTEAFANAAAAQQRRASWFDLLARPAWRFFRSYVIRLGFLDGWQGCYIAWMTAFYTATRYAKIRATQIEKT